MRQVPFTVIYHDGNNYRHKQFNGYHAQLVHDDFKAAHPSATILEVFCGTIGNIRNKDFRRRCVELYEGDMK